MLYRGSRGDKMDYKILICDDEKEILELIELYLGKEGYSVVKASDGQEAIEKVKNDTNFDLAIVDIMMPRVDGYKVIKEIRKLYNIPIIMLSAKNQDSDKILGLDLGADDYITKPFGTAELLARLRTALRHSQTTHLSSSTIHTFRNNELKMDFNRRLIMIKDEEIHLTQVEYKIVSLLAKNAGKVMTYDAIITNIWGPYADTNNRILRVNMANIRRKMETNPAEPKYIFTEIGIGYRMIEEDPC